MKCIVIKRFIDKKTHKVQEVGTVYECEKARFDEIQAKGSYLKEIKEPNK